MAVLNFGRLLRRARLFADRPAVTDLATGWRATYGEHLTRVAATVAGLRTVGVAPTDRVAVLAGSTYRYVELWHAGLAGGFVICPLNNRFTLDELIAVVDDAGCAVLLHDDEHTEQAREISSRVASVEQMIPLHGDGSGSDLASLTRQATDAELPPEPDESAPAALIYTGGTTGRPKGVLLSQRSIVTQIVRMQITCGSDPGHAFLSVMPMFHIGGIAAWGWFLPSGGHSYLLPAFEPGEVLRAISEHSITVVAGVPTMFALLLEHPDFEPEVLSSVQMAFYGAAPMWPDLLTRLLDVRRDLRFFQTYGMTETCGGATVLRPESHSTEDVSRLGSVGQPFFDVELAIRDPQDRRPLELGEVGEIWIKSGSNLIEYWGQPELTEDSVDDGWYRTGDAGRIDDEGFLYLADRVKDMIVTGGENVYSIEVENALSSFPGVLQAAVVGVPDPIWGERVHAFVVGAQSGVCEAELREHARSQIASYKVPKTWTIQGEPLPLSAAGKVLKTELRDRASAAEPRTPPGGIDDSSRYVPTIR